MDIYAYCTRGWDYEEGMDTSGRSITAKMEIEDPAVVEILFVNDTKEK